MRALMLVFFMHSLVPILPSEWVDGWSFRMRLAQAIASTTEDVEEQLVLTKIARFESNYRPDVADCRIKGAAGEVTAFQIIPRSKAERAALCVSLEGDARMALARVRESTRACRHLPREERLAIYARGSCASVEGRRLSRHRTPGDRVVRAFEAMIAAGQKTEQEKTAWNAE